MTGYFSQKLHRQRLALFHRYPTPRVAWVTMANQNTCVTRDVVFEERFLKYAYEAYMYSAYLEMRERGYKIYFNEQAVSYHLYHVRQSGRGSDPGRQADMKKLHRNSGGPEMVRTGFWEVTLTMPHRIPYNMHIHDLCQLEEYVRDARKDPIPLKEREVVLKSLKIY